MSVKCWPMNRACNDWLMLRNKGHGTCTWCSWTMVRRQLQCIVYYFFHCCGCGCGCFACRWHYKHSHDVLSLIFGYVRLCCWCFALRKPIKIHQPQLRSKLWTATVVLRRGNQNWYFCHQKHWKRCGTDVRLPIVRGTIFCLQMRECKLPWDIEKNFIGRHEKRRRKVSAQSGCDGCMVVSMFVLNVDLLLSNCLL